jgi:hypothetical protein
VLLQGLKTAMGDFVPIVTAVASGTFDSIENVLINIARHVPFLDNLRRRKELDQCLSGKVSARLACDAPEQVHVALEFNQLHVDEPAAISWQSGNEMTTSTAAAVAAAAAVALLFILPACSSRDLGHKLSCTNQIST